VSLESPSTEFDAAASAAVGRRVEPVGAGGEVHEVSVIDGRFTIARCSCGWHSAGRRLRATVRAEARDHALLYADGRVLSASHHAHEHR
jgi:hypothetical protein